MVAAMSARVARTSRNLPLYLARYVVRPKVRDSITRVSAQAKMPRPVNSNEHEYMVNIPIQCCSLKIGSPTAFP